MITAFLVSVILPQKGRDLISVHAGQANIQEHEFRMPLLCLVDPAGPS